MMSNGVSRLGINQDRDSISIWSVIVPPNIDRQKYIDQCYLTSTIYLINDNGEVFNDVKCGKSSMRDIDFPIDTQTLGSEVACITLPYSGEIRVIEVFNTNSQFANQKEDQFYFQKRYDGSNAGVLIDGRGKVILTAYSDQKGEVVINVSDKNKTGKLTINANGEVLIRSPKIQLNESNEPILLGTKTVQLISDLLDQLGKESAGPYPLLGNAKYLEIKNGLEKLKSVLSFVK